MYAVLHRDLYRGEIVWNRTRKRDSWGQKKPDKRAAEEWIRTPAPALRIVSDDLWTAVHRRLDETRRLYLRGTDGQLWGRPVHGADAKYLLAGMLVCARCGGNLDVRTRAHGSRRAHFYSCSTYIRKGKAICPEEILAPMSRLDRRDGHDGLNETVVDWFERELLDPQVLSAAFSRALERHLARGQTLEPIRADLRSEMAKVEQQIENITDAIAAGGADLPSVLTRLRALQRRREQFNIELHQVDAQAVSRQVVPVAELRRKIDESLKDWRGLLHGHVPQARQMLRKLLKGRITVKPEVREGRPGITLTAPGSFEKLFAYILPDGFSQALASPTGFEPVFWP